MSEQIDDLSFLLRRPRWQPPYEGGGYEETLRKTGAEQWIEENRVPPAGPLDMRATAAIMGATVDLEYDAPGQGRTTGTWDDIVVHARKDLTPGEQRITIAHELGHVYMSKVLFSGDMSNDAEVFSEYFGHELALPKSHLEEINEPNELTILELAKSYGISERAVVVQLMFAGKLPEQLIVRLKREHPKTGTMEIVDEICCFGCATYSYKPCLSSPEDNLETLDFSGLEIDFDSMRCKQELLQEILNKKNDWPRFFKVGGWGW